MSREQVAKEGTAGKGTASSTGPVQLTPAPGKRALTDALPSGPVVQRKESTGTEQMHADLYGDSSLAHGVGPAADKPYQFLVNSLTSSAFPWSSLGSKTPTVDVLLQWLDFYYFHELRPLDRDNLDRCDFNLSFDFNVFNVANIFVQEAKHAGMAYDEAMARSAIITKLRPMQDARRQQEDAANQGKGPAPYSPGPGGGGSAKATQADADNSTQATISWTYVPVTKHTELGSGKNTSDPPNEQVTGQWAQRIQKNGSTETDVTAGAQVTLSADHTTQQVQVQNVSAVVGGQWVKSFLNEFIQLQAVAQVILGATIQPGQKIQGAMTGARILTTAQGTVGGQAVFTIPGTDKKVQIFLQGQTGVGLGSGPATGDKSLGIGVQIVL
jgi:hypothetical protein